MNTADAPPIPDIPDTQPRPVPPVEGLAPGTVAAWLDWATRTLDGASTSARADAEVLMASLIEVPRSQLRLRMDDPILAARVLQYATAVERRRMGEPVAYITGRQGFWSLELSVNAAVLIPRADTETLVEWALQLAGTERALRILDLGTGSGAIALALARELAARARIVATDRSEAALNLARDNARALGIDTVVFRAGDWFAALHADVAQAFDLIVSNPPYIAESDPHLPGLRYEPRLALSSGADGLDAIRHIVSGAPAHLRAGAWLLIEHGHDQGAAVRALFESAGFSGVQTRRDFGNNERVTAGRAP